MPFSSASRPVRPLASTPRFSALLLLGLLFLEPWDPGSADARSEPIGLGAPLPAAAAQIELVSTEEERVTLDSLVGERGLLVLFTSNTCPYSVDWRDRIPGLDARGRERKIPLVLVNSNAGSRRSDDSPEAMAEQAAEHFAPTRYYVDADSKLADLLGASRTPEAFLFDARRLLVYHGVIDDHSGPMERVTRHYLTDAMDALAAGRPLADEGLTTSTEPLGCKIRRPRVRRAKPRPRDPNPRR